MSIVKSTHIQCDARFCYCKFTLAGDVSIDEIETAATAYHWLTVKSGHQHYCPEHAGVHQCPTCEGSGHALEGGDLRDCKPCGGTGQK